MRERYDAYLAELDRKVASGEEPFARTTLLRAQGHAGPAANFFLALSRVETPLVYSNQHDLAFSRVVPEMQHIIAAMLANRSINLVAFLREYDDLFHYFRDSVEVVDVGGVRLRGIAGFGDADHLAGARPPWHGHASLLRGGARNKSSSTSAIRAACTAAPLMLHDVCITITSSIGCAWPSNRTGAACCRRCCTSSPAPSSLPPAHHRKRRCSPCPGNISAMSAACCGCAADANHGH